MQDPAKEPRLLHSVEEATERLGIGRTTMYRLIRDAAIDSVRVGHRRLIPESALVAYIDRIAGTDPSN